MTEEKPKNKFLIPAIIGVIVLVAMVITAIVLSSQPSGSGGGDGTGSSIQGKFTVGNLVFDLPSEYVDKGDGFYEFRDDDNAIVVQVYKKDNYGGTVQEYIDRDENLYYPVKSSVQDTVINELVWFKAKGNDGDYLYYAKKGDTVYMVALSPVFAKTTRVNELIATFEEKLFIK